ncbi:hypothetical protein [Zhaonella formicivorans]|uniref:hypothetical protein n=1 Tax=Zhaonella formicivorans TaxID=2528593 RepID=UPI0010D6EEB8|nr:hypothetical protein [Zhaonella formicivorans]
MIEKPITVNSKMSSPNDGMTFFFISRGQKISPLDPICENRVYFFVSRTLEDLGQIPEELMKNANQPSVGKLLREKLIECADKGIIAHEEIELLQNLIGSSIHGKLLFFIKRRNAEGLDEMIHAVHKEIQFLMKASEKRG